VSINLAAGRPQLDEVPAPLAGPGQILVRVHAAGVNPVDTYIRSGAYAPNPPTLHSGQDAAGIVEKWAAVFLSLNRRPRLHGRRITGAYAEYVLCEPAQVHPLPDKLSFSQGAGVNTPYATAYRACSSGPGPWRGSGVDPGATGGVGIASVQLARAPGCDHRPAGPPKACAWCRTGRATTRWTTVRRVIETNQDLTNGRCVDVIVEMASHINLGKT